jgi:hypothetical protein
MSYRYIKRHVTHFGEFPKMAVNVRIGAADSGNLIDLYADYEHSSLWFQRWNCSPKWLPWSDLGDLSYKTERQRADAVEDLALKYWAETPPGEGGR